MPNKPGKNPLKNKKSANRPDDLHSEKIAALEPMRDDGVDEKLRTNQGVPITDNQNSLKAGTRGPTLLEDFIMREKITHFDHERIPERVVHARGAAAHGIFQVYESMAPYTRANFLQDPKARTPVFVRFSTVAGSRGSMDTARDARGFATKFYTQEGNYDLVGNNIPVFFIQDAIKFPDFVHAVKPEPHNEIPQAGSAHNTFWDFISLVPESMHMVMWVMSDRGIPRSLRMMEGFGIHTFRFINAKGESRFVKFHWKPRLGVHSLVWDEAQKLGGKDSDFHRRDLWEAIEDGDYPEFELGVQMFSQAEADKFDFDILDPTKLIPEELAPVRKIGKMILNRNPDNFFAETEQVAFHTGHVVPGIDFTNDPLLQGRLFSYTDTQLLRLGGANFHEIPINRPICPYSNNQRDGFHRQTINVGQASYEPNTVDGGGPKETPPANGGYLSYPEEMDGNKIRVRSESFKDHFSQATLFWNSQSPPEKEHIISAFCFELSKVELPEIRERIVTLLTNVDSGLAQAVADGLGLQVAPGSNKAVKPASGGKLQSSAALSMENQPKDTIRTRKIAILVAGGVDVAAVDGMKKALEKAGAHAKVVAPHLGTISGADRKPLDVDFALVTMPSVAFDAVFIPGGAESVTALSGLGDAIHFVREAYKHCKAIAAVGEGTRLLEVAGIDTAQAQPEGVVAAPARFSIDAVAKQFIAAIARHRHWNRPDKDAMPA